MLGLPLVNRISRLAALLVMTSSLAACSAPSPDPAAASKTPTSPAAVTTTAASATGATSTPKVLDFTAPKLGGGQVVGSELVGQDLAIFFWAPW
jgi:ABC-type glycerol-3-phosphate transport system substrate-binding protein